MSLTSEVQLRQQASRLIQLTNLNSDKATVLNAVTLAAAVADTQATFRTRVGIIFNDLDPEHIAIGCDGVMFFLHRYKGTDVEAVEARWEMGLKNFRNAKRAGIMSPGSNTPYIQTTDPAGSLPDSDRQYFTDLTADPPLGTSRREFNTFNGSS